MMSIADDIGLPGYFPDMSSPRYTQDFLNIDKVDYGMIITKDKRYLKLIEIFPINFFMRSEQEQDDIVEDFASWLTIAPINIQIKILTSEGNPEEMIERVEQRFRKDKDEDVQHLIRHYTDLLRELGSRGAITRRFIMIISYEPRTQSERMSAVEDIANELNKQYFTIKEYFRKIGNAISRIDISDEEYNVQEESWNVARFLYNYFNPRTSRNEGYRKLTSFNERVNRIYADEEKLNGEKGLPPMTSLLAPKSIDVSDPDCVIVDGMYYTHLVVSGRGYHNRVYGGWMTNLIQRTLPGESVDMFFHKESSKKIMNDVSQRITFGFLKRSEPNEAQRNYEQIESALASAQYIKSCINEGGQIPYTLTIVITLCSLRYNILMERKRKIMDEFQAMSMPLLPLKYIQENAMKSTMPLLSLDSKLYMLGKRNLMNYGLASAYPFTSYEMQNRDGFLLGLNTHNRSMVVLNPFDTSVHKNANMVLMGTSGSGKTYTLELMALRIREMGTQCFILAPDKAHEFKRASDSVNGSFIKISPASKNHINIMDIRPENSETKLVLEGSRASDSVLLSKRAETVKIFIELIDPEITSDEKQTLDKRILQTYSKFGITEDNDSIYVDPKHKEKGLKKMPTLLDLYNMIEEKNTGDEMDRVLHALEQYTKGSAKSFSGETNVDLSNKYIIFDLSELSDEMKPSGMFIALDFVMQRIKEDVLEKKMVFIDEGWQLIGTSEVAAKYVTEIFKTIRGYNGGGCIATQDIKDFFSLENGKYGTAILANSTIKILLQMENIEAEKVENELRLTRDEKKQLCGFKRGNCLVCSNQDHVPVHIIGSDYLTKLITTDPELVAKVVQEMKENGGVLR